MHTKGSRGAVAVVFGAAFLVVFWTASASALTTATSDVANSITTVSGSGGDDRLTLRVEPPASPDLPQVLRVADPGGVTSLDACTQLSATVASCSVWDDAAVFAGAGDDAVDLSYAPGARHIAVLYLLGGDGNDDLRGSDLADAEINGGPGDDRLDGRGGADFVDCGEGVDLLVPDILDTVTPGCENVADVIPPETTIVSGPSGIIVSRTPTFVFGSTEAGTFACQLDHDLFAACVSPFTTATLAPGPHIFRVTATDAEGNADPTPATRAFTVVVSEGGGGPDPGPGGAATAGSSHPAVRGSRTAGTVRVSSRGAFVLGRHRVSCPAGGSRCGVAITARKRARKLGGSSYRLAAGRSRAAKVALSRKGLRLLRRWQRIRATVTVSVTRDAQRATKKVRVTLRAPRGK